MIRRLFWMTLGAVAGVTGYRRVSRLARAIQPWADRGGRRDGWPGGGSSRGAALFLRDVRDGMELYVDRRSRAAGPTLEGQQALTERAGQAAASRTYPGTDYSKDGR
jgi:hypothetical protein